MMHVSDLYNLRKIQFRAIATPNDAVHCGAAVDLTCGPPAAISCSYRDTSVRCSVVGPFL